MSLIQLFFLCVGNAFDFACVMEAESATRQLAGELPAGGYVKANGRSIPDAPNRASRLVVVVRPYGELRQTLGESVS